MLMRLSCLFATACFRKPSPIRRWIASWGGLVRKVCKNGSACSLGLTHVDDNGARVPVVPHGAFGNPGVTVLHDGHAAFGHCNVGVGPHGGHALCDRHSCWTLRL